MAAMVLAVMLVTLASLQLIRDQVAKHFEDGLSRQFERQLGLLQLKRTERLRLVSAEIENSTSNPRLMAALLEDDFTRFYSDLAEELEPFYRRADSQYTTDEMWPFFRFIREGSRYLEPESGLSKGSEVRSLPGLASPFDEATLNKMLSGLASREGHSLRPRAGSLVGEIEGQKYLLRAFVCPVIDAFGAFLGDLVFVLPWQEDDIYGGDIYSAIILNGQVFEHRSSSNKFDWDSIISRFSVDSFTRTEQVQVVVDEQKYLLLNSMLPVDHGFEPVKQITLFSLEEQAYLQKRISQILFLITIGGFILSLLISLVLTQGLTRPISLLRKAAVKIGRGDFSTRVSVKSNDEIGHLASSFNQMVEGLQLKERYKAVLSKVADTKVADRLMRGEIDMSGETVEASVLFCDIRGFTAFSDGMDPQKLITILNEHMTAMTEVVYEYGGVVDKYVGDEIMVIFGAPIKTEYDGRNAYECAKKMVLRRNELNEASVHPLAIGVGLAHGKMVAGCMGSEARLNYTVLGDRVNLAARLCSQAKKMEVVFDETTLSHIGKDQEVVSPRQSPLKGFTDAPVFYVINPVECI